MKAKIVFHVAALLLLTSFGLSAAPVEKVQFTENKIIAWPQGRVLKAPAEIKLPFGIVVQTNGTFTVKGGKVRALEDGDILDAHGMLLKPDGSIAPVIDHVTLNRGRVLLIKDGEVMEPREAVQLADGTTVWPDRTIAPRNGSPRQLLDGELFRLEGETLPTRDTITVQNGRVLVQKDGSMIAIGAERSIMMNEGTKVLGDGTIIRFNGDRATIAEGQILTIEGVYTRPR